MKKTGYMDDGNITLLAKGVELKGEIKVDGTVRIDGRLEGEVHTKGEVIVGEDGVVKGMITAGS
ncbi:MAG: polymer-forming cytoskeletal protein, partial [Nitrospira sp.]|nr:polymer-forming cytoskeletal protein [Nitrospira sp.]